MSLPQTLFVLRLLARDTFRQSLASRVCWLMLGVSAICIALCLSLHIEGDLPLRNDRDAPEFISRLDRERALTAAASTVAYSVSVPAGAFPVPSSVISPEFRQVAAAARSNFPVISGRMSLGFGSIPVPLARDREHAVHFVQLQLAAWIADAAGLLLALVWTAGFLPTFLDPGAASVLLAKPVPRWTLLAGKYFGVLSFVAFQAILFVGGTWIALALRTGVWDGTYFLCVPILLFHFAVFFSFSVLLAVTTRNTVACVFGSLVFWLLCWAMNFGRHAVRAMPDLAETGTGLGKLVELGYWILPKPADIGIVLFNALGAQSDAGQLSVFQAVQANGLFWPEFSLLASLAFALVVLALSAREFATTDY
jgi:hypothetical protein